MFLPLKNQTKQNHPRIELVNDVGELEVFVSAMAVDEAMTDLDFWR